MKIADEAVLQNIQRFIEDFEANLDKPQLTRLQEDNPDDLAIYLVGYGQTYTVAKLVTLYQQLKEMF